MNILYKPLYIYFLYFFLTLFLYFFGPVDYERQYSIELLILLASYKIFLVAGYFHGAKKFSFKKAEIDLSINWSSYMLPKIIFIYLYLFLNLIIYIGFDFSDIFNFREKIFLALLDPLDSYNNSFETSKPGGPYIILLVFLSPLYFLVLANSLFSFSRIGILYKVLIVVAILLELYKWVIMGRNKGVFEVAILISLIIYSLNKLNHLRGSNILRIKKFTFAFISLALIMIALFYFDNALSARKFAYENYDRFDHLWLKQLVPDFLKSLVVNMTIYLSEGYRSLSLIVYENWTPMWGIGHSSILMDNFSSIFSYDFFINTYQTKLAKYGIDPLVNWHSAYVWFANDFHWLGVNLAMFAVGYLFSSSWTQFIKSGSISEFIIFYFMVITLIFLSGNTQVFNQTVTTFSFWVILFYSRIYKRFKF